MQLRRGPTFVAVALEGGEISLEVPRGTARWPFGLGSRKAFGSSTTPRTRKETRAAVVKVVNPLGFSVVLCWVCLIDSLLLDSSNRQIQ